MRAAKHTGDCFLSGTLNRLSQATPHGVADERTLTTAVRSRRRARRPRPCTAALHP